MTTLRRFGPALVAGLLLWCLAGCGDDARTSRSAGGGPPSSSDASDGAKEPTDATPPVYLYCGAGIRPPVAEAVEAFTAETGTKVQVDYAGSGVLLSRIRALRQGDLYLPGSIEYIHQARELELVRSHREICYFVPVILVRKGNPKGIQTLTDLAREGVRLGVGDPRSCAIGKLTERIFQKNHIPQEKVAPNVQFASATVNELGLQIKVGKLDAAIVWDAVAAYYADSAEAIPIPLDQNVISTVAIGVLRYAGSREAPQRFVEFLAGQRGTAIFRKHHYTTKLPAR